MCGRLRCMDLEDPEISRSIQDRVRLNEIHRVCGEVAVSRALGDVDFKGWTSSSEREAPCFAYPEGHPRRFSGDLLTAEPEIQVASLGQAHAFVVLATDGLWDVLDGEEAVRVVSNLLKEGKAPLGLARRHTVGRSCVEIGVGGQRRRRWSSSSPPPAAVAVYINVTPAEFPCGRVAARDPQQIGAIAAATCRS